jgi:phage shock protein C
LKEKLYRSQTQKIVGGVCGGIAEYFDLDVTLIRFLWILVAFMAGSGVIAYIIGMIIIPPNPHQLTMKSEGKAFSSEGDIEGERVVEGEIVEDRSCFDSTNDKRKILGLILIGFGIYFGMNMLWGWRFLRRLWPLVFIAVGIYILFGVKKEG